MDLCLNIHNRNIDRIIFRIQQQEKENIVENYYVSVFHIDTKNQYHQHTIWAEKVSWSWTKMRAKFIRRHNILYLSNSSCIIILHPKRHLFFFVILVKKEALIQALLLTILRLRPKVSGPQSGPFFKKLHEFI